MAIKRNRVTDITLVFVILTQWLYRVSKVREANELNRLGVDQ